MRTRTAAKHALSFPFVPVPDAAFRRSTAEEFVRCKKVDWP